MTIGTSRTQHDAVRRLNGMLPLEMHIHLTLAAVRQGCRTVLDLARQAGHLRPGLDLDAETLRPHVLLDGIAFHLLGGLISGEESEALLPDHLASRWR